MKILLLGCAGQVGWELQRSLAVLGEVVALDRRSTPLCGDIGQLQALAQTVRTVRPDVIVNAAAHTAVDKAESEPELARLLNAAAPGVLAHEALALDALLVHYSTMCSMAAARRRVTNRPRWRRCRCTARPSWRASRPFKPVAVGI